MTRAELHAKLDELAALPDNWDSYGSPALTAAALATARILADRFVDPMPTHIGPVGGGGLQFEWTLSELEVLPSGEITAYDGADA